MTETVTSHPRSEVELVGDRQMRVLRTFAAPRERVFEAFIDPELIPQWWGPRGHSTRVDVLEPVEGGAWRFVSTTSEGAEHAFRGEFREISRHDVLAQSFEYEGAPGHITEERAIFEQLEDGSTLVTMTSTFAAPEARDAMVQTGMEKGMRETHERLDELLAKLAG